MDEKVISTSETVHGETEVGRSERGWMNGWTNALVGLAQSQGVSSLSRLVCTDWKPAHKDAVQSVKAIVVAELRAQEVACEILARCQELSLRSHLYVS